MDEAFGQRVARVGALADPVRRALYRFVAEAPGAVSRDQAASGVDVPRHTAKFHLERLVEEGLLVTEFRRLTGRTGPGAGRPAKLYRRSRRELTVSLPSRRYDLAGQVLADAVERTLDGTPIADALVAAVDDAADQVATEGRSLAEALTAVGYEPRAEGAALMLGNCPFDRIAADHRGLVCGREDGLNRAFVDGLVRRLGGPGATTEAVAPGPGCCVRVGGAATHP